MHENGRAETRWPALKSLLDQWRGLEEIRVWGKAAMNHTADVGARQTPLYFTNLHWKLEFFENIQSTAIPPTTQLYYAANMTIMQNPYAHAGDYLSNVGKFKIIEST